MNLKISGLVSVFLAIPALLVAEQASSQEWEWTVAPYLWASDVGMDLAVNGDPVIGVNVPISDLIDKLDAGFMGHFEGRNENWGLYLDIVSISLSDITVTPLGPGGPFLGDITVNANLDLGIYDVGALRRYGSPESGGPVFDFLAGARVIDMDIAANIVLPGPGMTQVDISTGPSETDVMIGGRLTGQFNPRWHWLLRGDFSFGGTEGTYNGIASVGYTFGQSKLFSLDLGYRYMRLEI